MQTEPSQRTEEAEWMRAKAQAWEQATLPPKLFQLRQKLSQKAKQEPKFRFYTLYGRIFQMDTLLAAWKRVAANQGAPGIDGVTLEQLTSKAGAIVQLLEELQEELRSK